MEKRKDFYLILGVPRDASAAAIKRAYRRLAKRLHPDVVQGSSAEQFRDLQVAYETLADTERRRRYDEDLGRTERYDPEPWSYLRGRTAGDLRRPLRPGALSGEILLTKQEAAAGGVLPLDVPLEASCPACEGTGGLAFDCDRCFGEGTIEQRVPIALRIPPGVKDGVVFQVAADHPGNLSIFLTVHIRAF